MRYVKKLNAPQSFSSKTSSLVKWSEYHNCCNRQKRALRKYILKYEQNSLCIYCEGKISSTNESSHLEHIKPKHLDIEKLTFDYTNIAVSCNGHCESENGDKTNYNCGHRKDRDDTPYDDAKFLNPVIIEDIRNYFEYDIDDGLINPSNKDIGKSQYMIDTLHLNDSDGGLRKARKLALKNFIKKMKGKNKKEIKERLDKENLAFISFLRYRFKRIL